MWQWLWTQSIGHAWSSPRHPTAVAMFRNCLLACYNDKAELRLLPSLANLLAHLKAKVRHLRAAAEIQKIRREDQWALSLGTYIANLEVAVARQGQPSCKLPVNFFDSLICRHTRTEVQIRTA